MDGVDPDTLLEWQQTDVGGERVWKAEKERHEVGSVLGYTGGKEPKRVFPLINEKVVESKEYYYRVRAVNKAGPGDPCDHGRPYKIMAKPGRFFYLSYLNDSDRLEGE